MVKETGEERFERLSKLMSKSVTFKHLRIEEDKSVTCTEIDYYASDNPCGICGTDKWILMNAQRNAGVLKICAWCGSVQGPLSKKDGRERKRYKVSPREALKILKDRDAPKFVMRVYSKLLKKKRTPYRPEKPRPQKTA